MEQSAHTPAADLERLVRLQKKQVGLARLAAFACIIIALALCVALVILIPRVLTLADHMETSLSEIDEIAVDAGEAVKQADTMLKGVNRILDENTETTRETIEKLNSIDFARLNDAIAKLDAAVEPLAKLSEMFR